MDLEIAITLASLLAALWLRPWRMLSDGALITPMLGSLVMLSWLWSLPFAHHMPLQLHWSGAPLATLMLGWPLATLTLVGVGVLTYALSPASPEAVMALVCWQGLVPATFTLLLGAALRRWVPHHPFVYVLGRGFLGSVLSIFVASLIAQWTGHELPNVSSHLSIIGFWLMAWGDAFITGMLCAIFVAFRPQWLATWSDEMYLKS